MGYHIERGRAGGLDRLIIPRCRRSVNVVFLNGGVVVETYLNGDTAQGRVLIEECG